MGRHSSVPTPPRLLETTFRVLSVLLGCGWKSCRAALTSQSGGGKHFGHSGLCKELLPRDKSAAFVTCAQGYRYFLPPTRDRRSIGLFLSIVYLQFKFNSAASPERRLKRPVKKNKEKDRKTCKILIKAAVRGKPCTKSRAGRVVTTTPPASRRAR